MREGKKKAAGTAAALRRVLRYLRAYRGRLALSLLFAALSVGLTLMVPLLIGQAVDFIVGKGRVDFDAMAPILLKIAACTLATALLQWLMNVLNNTVTYEVVRDIRREAFRKIEILPLRYLDSHACGEIVSRVTADVDQLADGLLLGFTQLFTGVMTILGTLVFMLLLHPWITLVVVVMTPISLFVARFISTHTHSMFRLQSETRGRKTWNGSMKSTGGCPGIRFAPPSSRP